MEQQKTNVLYSSWFLTETESTGCIWRERGRCGKGEKREVARSWLMQRRRWEVQTQESWQYRSRLSGEFSSIQSLSRVWLFVTPWIAACQVSLSITNSMSPNPCPLSWWCHPTISSSIVAFSSCLQSFPASGSFLVNWLFTSDVQSIGASASGSVPPMSIEWILISFRIDWLDLLIVQGTLKSLLQHYSSKASIFQHSALFYIPTLTSIHN